MELIVTFEVIYTTNYTSLVGHVTSDFYNLVSFANIPLFFFKSRFLLLTFLDQIYLDVTHTHVQYRFDKLLPYSLPSVHDHDL